MTGNRLAVDGGQTGTRLRLTDPSGAVLEEHEAPGVLTDRPILPQVAAFATELSERSGRPVGELALGLSGLTPAASRPDVLLAAVAPLGVRRVALAHDSVSGYLAANGTATGAMLAVGTGVVILAVSETSVAKVDGWGYLVGDVGSGFWIGRSGLDAAMRAFDGRGEPTVLEAAARDRFGALDELYMVIQGDERRVSIVASFARTVIESAAAGDVVALRVVRAAAAELAHSATTALRRTGWVPGTPTRVGAVGAPVTRSALMKGALAAALATEAPGAQLASPLGEPIDGVAALLDVAPRSPLAASILVASA
ncbi:N-acetylglucosamine kinase-like BadF-type ATPase [Labedella gwakjiensis]|uniref:ATPase n=1 Tax=Labedella gwakjiensis TaxID=390269 RepID=A0A2P8GSY9_9MICO|nr:BadF/BadG/BcrA/BcrD ATPase family protein [Labedella gwakjiensis]PSL37083.1 N-acetylglucosamine kinase-like BadF-type ATPase [Labedella gwakjiensis]RUQ82012.1 ATPase [Labedella gwakjiensis]